MNKKMQKNWKDAEALLIANQQEIELADERATELNTLASAAIIWAMAVSDGSLEAEGSVSYLLTLFNVAYVIGRRDGRTKAATVRLEVSNVG